MAKYDDYVKVIKDEENDEVLNEIKDASQQQVTRQEETPDVDWEKRYADLEKMNSRQAQDLGNYRRMVDDYIVAPPEAEQPPSESESPALTVDQLYENPAESIQDQVSAHPAIRRVEALEAQLLEQERGRAQQAFETKHPDYTSISADPAFANWVAESPTHTDLATRAHAFDFSAADALFELYKASTGLKTVVAEAEQASQIQAANLEAPAQGEPPAPESFSRSAMLQKKIEAKQGNLESEAYVRATGPAYLKALSEGNVRD